MEVEAAEGAVAEPLQPEAAEANRSTPERAAGSAEQEAGAVEEALPRLGVAVHFPKEEELASRDPLAAFPLVFLEAEVAPLRPPQPLEVPTSNIESRCLQSDRFSTRRHSKPRLLSKRHHNPTSSLKLF